MQRWKLWTSIASAVLSLGGGSTYYLWSRPTAAETPQVAAGDSAPSPHALPPEPLQDVAAGIDSGRFATPASFNEPSDAAAPVVRANDDGAFPLRPSAGAVPAQYQSAEFDPREPVADGSRYRESVADMPAPPETLAAEPSGLPPADPSTLSPAADPSAAAGDAPPFRPSAFAMTNGGGGEPAAEPAPLAEPPSALPPDEVPASDPAGVGAAEPASLPSEPAGDAADAVAETVSDAGDAPPADESPSAPAAAPLRPLALPAAQPLAPTEAAPESAAEPSRFAAPNRFSNPSRPAAPSLRSASPNGLSDESAYGAPDTGTSTPAKEYQPAAPGRDFASRGSGLVSNTPGERRFEGVQAPSLSVERAAPEEIQVGKPAKFLIKVRNIGQVAAQDVVVSDQVPKGTRFLAAVPETFPAADGRLTWELGELAAGEDAILSVELMPEAEGEIGSVAAVTFRAAAAVRTIATRPLLKVEHTGPAKVLIGEDVPFQITVSNPGTGIATDVVVEVDVPEGLAHDGGREIMSDRFDLRPNETRKIDLLLRAMSPGVVQNVVRAVGSGTLAAEHRTQLEVLAPQLQVGAVGATRRFLDRPVKYQIVVANPGTAPAQNIELVAHLPRGLKFTSADKKGQYDPRQHAVMWNLEELPAGEQGIVELTAIPTDTGEQKLHIDARASLGLEHQHEHTTVVEDITDLVFTVTDENVPIEIGSETIYQIRVANNGTKGARNVQLTIQVPTGLEVTEADGPTQAEQRGDQIVLQPLPQLGPNEEAVYRVTARGTRAGDHVLRVQLLSDEFSTPVTKEEITKVYSDK